MTTTPLTLDQAAAALGVSKKTLRRLIARKRIGTIRYSERGRVYIDPDELDEYQNGCRTKAKPPKSVTTTRARTKRPQSSDCLPREKWGTS